LTSWVRHPTALADGYRCLHEICVDVGLVRRGDPELPDRPPTFAGDVVPLLRHVLRLACGTTAAARRTQPDLRFSQLVARLHDTLVTSADVEAARSAQRFRDGMQLADIYRENN